MNFFERVTGMFLKPEATIKDILAEPRLEEGLVVVAIHAAILLISSYITSAHFSAGGAVDLATIAVSMGITVAIVLIGWVIATAIVHYMAIFLGGEGKFSPEMLTAIGYTYVAKIPFDLIAVLFIVMTPVVAVPVITGTATTADLKPYVEAMTSFYYNPFFIGSIVVGFIGLIYSCYLGMLAVKNGDKVSMLTAAIVVGVPMVIYIVISVVSTFATIYLLQAAIGAM